MSDQDLKDKEQQAVDPDAFEDDFGSRFSDEEKEKLQGLSDQLGDNDIPFRKEGAGRPRGGKFRMNKRRGVVGGGILGLVIAGAIGLTGILQGPGQFIHFAQLLQKFHLINNENFGDSRTGRLFTYLTTLDSPNDRNLSRVMNVPAKRYERHLKNSGIEMEFKHPTKNGKNVRRIQFFNIDPTKDGGQKTIDALRSNGVDIPPPRKDGIIEINVRGKNGTELSRQVIRSAVESINMSKISGSMGYRLLIRRALVDFHPFKNKAYEKSQDNADSRRAYNEDIREETAERDKNGVDGPNTRVGGVRDVDEDGNVENDTTDDAEGANDAIGSAGDADSPGKLAELKLKFKGFINGTAYAGAAVGLVCAARSLGNQVELIEHENITLPLIRIGTRIITSGNQIMNGQGTNLDEIGAINETFYNEEDGTSWAAARSIQAENGEPLTGPDIEDEARPSKVGEKPTLFQILDNPTIGEICELSDRISGLPIIKQVGDVADGILNKALGLFGWSTEKLMLSLASLFAAEQVDALAEGAKLGNYANYGARLSANDSAISMGGRALTGTETALLDQESRYLQQERHRQSSFFARYFDLNEPDSLAAKSIYENPAFSNPQSALAQVFQNPLKVFSNLTNSLVPNTFAQASQSYDYGFPEYGYALEEQDDERLENPLENAELIEDRLEKLNKRYGPHTEGDKQYGSCFGTAINQDGTLSVSDAVKYSDANHPKCKEGGETFSDGTNELVRYRMYLADMVTAHSLACYEGETSSCQQLGFTGESIKTEASDE